MKAISILGIALLFCTDLYAARFNGVWSGAGEALGNRRDRQCHEVFFQFEENAEELKIIYGGYTCEDMQAEYPFSTFQKFSGFLVYKEQMVGTYTANSFELNVPSEFYRLSVELDDNDEMTSIESWDDGRSFLIVQTKRARRLR